MRKILFILFIIFVSISSINAQIITTIAGIGTSSYSGEGGPATAASLVVHDVFTDTHGNMYIAAREDSRVCKIDLAGIITTYAGGGTALTDGVPATTAQLGAPNFVAADNVGNVYITIEGNMIKKVNAAGIITTIAGNGTGGWSGDGGPATAALINDAYGIKVDGIGNIYFADAYNNRIRKIDTSGIISTLAGTGGSGLSFGAFSGDGGPATAAQLSDPTGIFLDGSGNIFFTDDGNNRVRKIDSAGIITTIAGSGSYGPGSGSYSGDSAAATVATFNTPFGITVDGCGNIYITDNINNCIREVNTSGIITTMAGIGGSGGFGGDGGLATLALLHGPSGIGFDLNGNLLVADDFNDRLRKISNVAPYSGTITGIDSICHDHTITLTDTVPGGTWSSSNTSISTVTSAGIVTGVSSGNDSIIYTIIAGDCTLETTFPFKVSSPSVCNTETPSIPTIGNETVNIYPNPAYTGQFTMNVLSDKDEQTEIAVSSLLGEKITEIAARTNKPVNISLQVPDGIYIISAATPANKWNERILISNH